MYGRHYSEILSQSGISTYSLLDNTREYVDMLDCIMSYIVSNYKLHLNETNFSLDRLDCIMNQNVSGHKQL